MDIVEFQGGKYHLLTDGMGGFKLSPVEYRAKPCSLAQIAAEFKAEREEKAESKVLSRITHKGQEWEVVADSLGLKLVLVTKTASHLYEAGNPKPMLSIVTGKAPQQTEVNMQEPNWAEAPADATHYSKHLGAFLKADPEAHDSWLYWSVGVGLKTGWLKDGTHPNNDLIERPQAEEACNGGEASRYPTASEINQRAMRHLLDRAKTYDQPEGERSMGNTVRAFNAITGKNLSESDGWLLMQILKDVRQWQNPNEYHADSAEDAIAYASLKAEALAGGR